MIIKETECRNALPEDGLVKLVKTVESVETVDAVWAEDLKRRITYRLSDNLKARNASVYI